MQHISKLKNTLLVTVSTWTAELYPIFPRVSGCGGKTVKTIPEKKKSNRVPHNTIFPRNTPETEENPANRKILFMSRTCSCIGIGLFKYYILRKTTPPDIRVSTISFLWNMPFL